MTAFNPCGLIVIDGNSMTREFPGVNAFGNWLQAALGTPPQLGITITGEYSLTTAQLIARAPTAVDPIIVKPKETILLFWEIINSLATGRGVDGTVSDLTAYVKARHTAKPGLVVGLMTALPFAGAVPQTTLDWQRLAVNTQVRCGETGADFVVDIAAFTPFTKPDAYTNEYYQPDHVHPSQVGSRAIGEFVGRDLDFLEALASNCHGQGY